LHLPWSEVIASPSTQYPASEAKDLITHVPAPVLDGLSSEGKRLKQVEDENAKLKRLLGDAILENAALKDL
jgi:hypothetical protein